MYCEHCGKQIREEMLFCPYCGAKQSDQKGPPSYHLVKKERQDETDRKAPRLGSRAAFICVIVLVFFLLLCILLSSLSSCGNPTSRTDAAASEAIYAPAASLKPSTTTAPPKATADPDNTIILADLEGYWWCEESNRFIGIYNLSSDGKQANCFYVADSSGALRRGNVNSGNSYLYFNTDYKQYYPNSGWVDKCDCFYMNDVLYSSKNSFSCSFQGKRFNFTRQFLLDSNRFSGIWYMESDPTILLNIMPDGTVYTYIEDSPDEYDEFTITFYTDVVMVIEPGTQEWAEFAPYTASGNRMQLDGTTWVRK